MKKTIVQLKKNYKLKVWATKTLRPYLFKRRFEILRRFESK